jgi:hypothetical protein
MNGKNAIKVVMNVFVIFFMYLIITFKTEKFERDPNTHVHKTQRLVSTDDGYHTIIDEKYETIHSHESSNEPIHNQYFSGNYDINNIYRAGHEYFLEILLKLTVIIFVVMSLMIFNEKML